MTFWPISFGPEGPVVQHRQQEQREERGAEQSADDNGSKRTLHFAPVEVETAIGMKPKLATQAVISTGRSLRRAPASTAFLVGAPATRAD